MKYRFVLQLPQGIEIDSDEQVEGAVVRGLYSHAEPITLRGIFDTYEEAEKIASNFEVYKYIIKYFDPPEIDDSFEFHDLEDPDELEYFLSPSEAENVALYRVNPFNQGVIPTTVHTITPEYRIEEMKSDDKAGETCYKYVLFTDDRIILDSYKDLKESYESHDAAEIAALDAQPEYEYEVEVEDCEIEISTVAIEGYRIEEIPD